MCNRCNPGYFQSQRGKTNCPSCPAGYVCEDRGTIAPVSCQVSEYCPEGSTTSTSCPLGFFCEDAGTKIPCASSTDFCPTGSITRTPCPGNSACTFDVVCSEGGLGATVWLNEPNGHKSLILSLLPHSSPQHRQHPLPPSPRTPLDCMPPPSSHTHTRHILVL